jgi:GNAT superfamily N-acetyltransferase
MPDVDLTRLVVRPIREDDLDAADRVFRIAFGTYLGAPDPARFGGDGDCIRTRTRSDGVDTLVAELDGAVVGSNVVTSWGSVGFFGPLTVRPDLWDKGIGRALLAHTAAVFERRRVRVRGLFTFSQSTKHVRLYQHFGFWPRFLNVTLSTAIAKRTHPELDLFDGASDRGRALAEVADLCDSVFPGFDPTGEVRAVSEQRLGDTVLVRNRGRLVAFAVCHVGAGSEGGSGVAYMKIGAVRPGPDARAWFVRLLDACEAFASARGAERLRGGVHTSRIDAYRMLLDRGWRSDLQGVSMLSPADCGGYDRPDAFVIEDWR